MYTDHGQAHVLAMLSEEVKAGVAQVGTWLSGVLPEGVLRGIIVLVAIVALVRQVL